MKKTIAILLVLVIGMVGVFAADATLSLTTTVAALNEFKITTAAIGANDTHDYSKYAALTTQTTTAVTRDGGISSASYLTVLNNSTTAYNIGVKASRLAATDITTTIGFTVSCGSASNVPALEPADATSSNTYTQALGVTGTVTDGLVIASAPISIIVNANDFNSAAAGSYTGYIYFNVTAV